jgi:hypothetical protein
MDRLAGEGGDIDLGAGDVNLLFGLIEVVPAAETA